MKIIDNINALLGDDLKASLNSKDKLKIAASCFSIYAYEALKSELSKVESLEFIFTAPTFVPNEVTDKLQKEHREFFIPKMDRERSLYGSEFEIQLRNKLTQRAIARECAEWMQRKATFRSNKTKAPMQQFACVQQGQQEIAYMPLHGFTAVDLGYQRGDAVSNIVNRFDEPAFTTTYLQLFEHIWNDPEKLEDVTAVICGHIASVYQENSPERIYFLMLYNIFSEFLTTNLLKRLESSVEAFRLTLGSLHENNVQMLSRIQAFRQSGGGTVTDWTERLETLEAEDDELPILGEDEIGGKVKISLADMDLPSWENDLSGDLAIIDALLTSMDKIKAEDDAKLQHLQKLILDKIDNPINDGNKKILLFTAFADTANYLYNNLAELLKTKGLHTGKVTGKDAPKSTLKKGYDFQSLLTLFSPIAKEKALVLPDEPGEIDLLIGTDCISEGQNLQDCDYLVNYDIHWNLSLRSAVCSIHKRMKVAT